jgi:hypothetical protein
MENNWPDKTNDCSVVVDFQYLLPLLEAVGMGQRVWKILLEIIANMEANGKSTPDWKRFRLESGMHQQNIGPTLKKMEQANIFHREITPKGQARDNWDVLRVNPLAIRHRMFKERFLGSQIVTYTKRRGRMLDLMKDKGKSNE